MNVNQNNNNITNLENYMRTVSPVGDWRNPVLDTPLMSKFVTNMYDPKNSQPNKLSYFYDIIDSFSNPTKQMNISTQRFKGLPPQYVEITKQLTNDTINFRSDSTLAFLNENLRKEFVQAEYQVTGTNLNGQAAERELSTTPISADGITQILSNLTSLDLFAQSLSGIVDSVLPDVLPMAAILQSANPDLFGKFRKLLSAVESLGVVFSVLKGLHDGAIMIKPVSTVSNVQGITVDQSVIGSAPLAKTMADVNNDIINIANSLSVFGQHVPARVKQVLETSATSGDVEDLKSIILNLPNLVSTENSEKFALAISTSFASAGSSNIPKTAPNILAAMLYVSKIHADKVTNTNAQTQDVAQGFNHITGIPLSVNANYRCDLSEAIMYDMISGNANATNAFGVISSSPEISSFARTMLSRQVSGYPQLTKQALMNHVKSASPMSTNITTIDVDEFMKSRHYVGNSSAPACRQDIISSVIKAIGQI